MRRRSKGIVVLSLALATAPVVPLPVFAATTTTTFTVTLTLQNDCKIAANAMNFGSSGVIVGNIDLTTTITVTCSNGASYAVGLDAGSTPGSTISNRLLAGSGAPTVAFQLYRDTGYSQVWGETAGTTVGGTGTGAAVTLPVYGRVPPQTTPAADTYSSTVTATVTF